MLKYPCLVLDHDDTVVQSEKTIGYPFFCKILQDFRPGCHISFYDYVMDCCHYGFAEMCRRRFQFTEKELRNEYLSWMEHIRINIPPVFPGIDEVIRRQKENGGLICVVSHSSIQNITRDYGLYFNTQPDDIFGWDLPEEKRKPNPYPLQEIMRKYNLAPKDILVVDDMKLAWQMAHPLGISIAFAAWGKTEFPEISEEMRKLCNHSFDSAKDLAKFLFD